MVLCVWLKHQRRTRKEVIEMKKIYDSEKDRYERLSIEVIAFDTEDIITVSKEDFGET